MSRMLTTRVDGSAAVLLMAVLIVLDREDY
jgi:hypothetical protein